MKITEDFFKELVDDTTKKYSKPEIMELIEQYASKNDFYLDISYGGKGYYVYVKYAYGEKKVSAPTKAAALAEMGEFIFNLCKEEEKPKYIYFT